MPRCLTPVGGYFSHEQLHAFCDASLKAHSAVIYARFVFHNASAHVASVMAKLSVAPLKPLSASRLELQAAVLGATLIKTDAEEIGIEIKEHLSWSDSITVI